MPQSDDAIAAAYIRHGLALIRAANGIASEADKELAKLATDIRYLLARATLTDMGRRALNALLRDIEDVTYQRYNRIIDDQTEQLAELADIESHFAATQSGFDRTISAATIISGLLILGSTLKDWWRKQASDLAFKIGADIKAAQRTAEPDSGAIGAIFGAIRGQSGEMGIARRNASALTHTAAWAAASDARLATFRANGVKFIEWHAILDAKVCPICGLRAGKLWMIDGEPVKHDIPLSPIPAHHWCRCIAIPHSGEPPADGGPHLRQFDDWLATLTDEQENDLLGKGRAELYRRKVITLADLLNQNGQLLTLAELRASVGAR